MLAVKGQLIRIKSGQFDNETGINISGWSGMVLGTEEGMIEIEWDANTLARMPTSFIQNSEENGYDHSRYWIEVECVEPFTSMPLSLDEPGSLGRRLLSILKDIRGSGEFAVSGSHNFVPPGMQVEGLGEIGFPIVPIQAKALIDIARQAPFGRGSKTITDTTVRNTWEIDAQLVSFHNPAWPKFFQKNLKTVKKELGIKRAKVTASFYKLLIYEKNGFFLPHKDSEKEKGMFGTLVLGLPSTHSGGELLIQFEGKEKRIDFSEDTANYRIPFAAFYADCEHEVKPVRSGYRVCLVYNLLQSDSKAPVDSPRFGGQVAEIADLLRAMEQNFGQPPKAILLGHQYTPANFSLSSLKGQDRSRAAVLMEAAQKAGYFTRLGLVTHYRLGELEGKDYDYGYGRYYYDEKEESNMGEVYEEYTLAENWAVDNEGPNLGKLYIRAEDILSEEPIGKGKPIDQAEEGFTGNAGMTIEYWYHYGAIFLWPQSAHSDLFRNLSVPAQLEWLDYYEQHWDEDAFFPKMHTRSLLASMSAKLSGDSRETQPCFNPAAAALTRIRDEAFVREEGIALLETAFHRIDPEQWASLLQVYDPALFEPLFSKIAARATVPDLGHLLDALTTLDKAGKKAFVSGQLKQLPPFLHEARLFQLQHAKYHLSREKFSSQKAAITSILKSLLALSHYHEHDAEWIDQTLRSLCETIPRNYVNEVLVPLLRSGFPASNKLAMALRKASVKDLKKRVEAKPSPPADWSRETPRSRYYQEVWNLLRPFLSSPTETTFDYVAIQGHREVMEQAIREVTIDLRMETIRKGRPFTLRLTKTQATYQRSTKEWEEDVKLLKSMQNSSK
ncbi:MAG: 2OG-Fe(II) oxygenase [Saprospirales bacterium]|nr:2OG-Fe(II) oxygenase [Saprospirales bacterium]